MLGSETVRERIAHADSFASAIQFRNERIRQRFVVNQTPRPCPGQSPKRALNLNMDHQRVDYWDYLWAYIFIVPNATFLWATGCLWMKLRDVLYRRVWTRLGWRHPSNIADPDKLVGKLLLEGTQMVQFVGKFKKDGKKIAKFIWTNLPLLGVNGKYELAKMMTISLDLDERSFHSGSVLYKDGEQKQSLDARDALILIWFHTIFANHVKLHAYANWATNSQEATFDAFVHRMSVTTTMYNYFGFSVFPRICGYWKSFGISSDFHDITQVINQGVQNGVPEHGGIMELAPHSELARFIGPVRKFFHKTFKDHTKEFKGVDAEALFIGTIMHSLDHTLMGWNVVDPLYIDVERCNPRFRVMAELGRFVRAGFVDDLPGLLFNKNYSNAPTPFYQKVYKFAAKKNKKLADAMDCCIVK